MRFGKNLSYAETALKVRQIGEYCIRKRLTALENNEEVPHDILTFILQTVREYNRKINYSYTCIMTITIIIQRQEKMLQWRSLLTILSLFTLPVRRPQVTCCRSV